MQPPGPPHWGRPEQFIKNHPPLSKLTKKAGNGDRRLASRAAARGPPPGPDPRGEVQDPGRGSPASAFSSSGGPGLEAEGAEAERASAAQPEGPVKREAGLKERPGDPRRPRRLSPYCSRRRRPKHPCTRPLHSRPLLQRCRPRLTARTRRKWRAPGVALRRGRWAAALEPDQSGIRRGAGARRAGPYLTVPAGHALSPAPRLTPVRASGRPCW